MHTIEATLGPMKDRISDIDTEESSWSGGPSKKVGTTSYVGDGAPPAYGSQHGPQAGPTTTGNASSSRPEPGQDGDAFLALNKKFEAGGAMTMKGLEILLRDIQGQPEWRVEADLNAAYYDNYQTTPEMRERARELGQPVAVVNLISRTINVMLGQEAKSRTSWRCSADSSDMEDLADVLNYRLTESQRETKADAAISEAYGGQCKAGMAWVEVMRNADPYAAYPYRVEYVHRNEIWWDWRDNTIGLDKARWLARSRWLDLDDAQAMMPQFADMFECYQTDKWTALDFDQALSMSPSLQSQMGVSRTFSVPREEWYDFGRKRIKFYEVWYRVKVPSTALVVPDFPAVEYEPGNPIHEYQLKNGGAKLQDAPKTVIRMAMFAGPHRIMDVETKKKSFPYVPFWGFREDISRAPYSPVSGMRYPQDEYNARRSRLMALLQTVQMFIDSDALATKFNTIEDMANNIMRTNAVFVMNPGRQNREKAVDFRRDISLPSEQIEVMNDAKALIQDQPGMTSPMVGEGAAKGMSGTAMSGLLEQGLTAMGDFNDNYRYARQKVGELLAELIVEDLGTKPKLVWVGIGTGRRQVVINGWDPVTQKPINQASLANVKLALSEAPSTPAYKLQQQQLLMQVLQASNGDPTAMQVLLPSFLESTDLPNRAEDAALLRKKWNIPDPQDRNAQQQADALAQQKQAEVQQAQVQLINAKAEGEQATAMLNQSTAEVNHAKAQKLMMEAAHPPIPPAPPEAKAPPKPTSSDLADQAIADSMVF